jgi:hypothetical protein
MTFKQLSTGTLLSTDNEDVIEFMSSSNAYVEIKQSKNRTAKSGNKGKEKSAE